MRTLSVAVRTLLAGVAVLVSQGTSRAETPAELAATTVFDRPLTPAVDGTEKAGTQASVDAVSRAEEAPLPIMRLEQDSKEPDFPWAKAAADAAAAPQRMADFRVPRSGIKQNEQIPELAKDLQYQYGYGSESEVIYRTDPDLNAQVDDDFLLVTPEVNGYVTYRPVDWLEMTLEMILEQPIAVHEEDVILLPNGELKFKEDRDLSLIVDQAFVTLGAVSEPVRLSLGRKNFEDVRHWLYDTSMDAALLTVKHGDFRSQAVFGREVFVDLDALIEEPTDEIDIYMLETEYRGIEDIKIAGYAMHLKDNSPEEDEGERWLFGLRSHGMPTNEFSYWAELAYLHGQDSQSDTISAYAFDVGATYRWTTTPSMPNATLGFALGSGDRDPDDGENNNFRQTGLESNEVKFAGLAEFKGYGEVLNPELSNLQILTAGVGIAPAPNMTLDLVFHQYWLDRYADELTHTDLTAEPNQVDGIRSRDIGRSVDIVLGLRKLFDTRLGLDVRVGLFFPGQAYLIDESTDDEVHFRDAHNGHSLVVKLWW